MRWLASCLCALALLGGCATGELAPRVTKEDVVELARAGADAEWIIDRLVETRTILFLTASDLVELHAKGVPQAALDWMQLAQMQELRRREAMLQGGPFGPCSWPGRPGWEPRYGWRFSSWPCW